MRPSPKLLFILTDGGRARLVRRSATTGHFETLEEIEGLRDLEAARRTVRAHTAPRVRSSAVRGVKEQFLDQVAEHAVATCRGANFSGIFIAAPRRLIGPLRARLQERAPLAGVLAKDLTKTPINRLDDWLGGVIPAPLPH